MQIKSLKFYSCISYYKLKNSTVYYDSYVYNNYNLIYTPDTCNADILLQVRGCMV